MRTAHARSSADFTRLAIATLLAAAVLIMTLTLYAKLLRALDDPMIAVILTLTALVSVVAVGNPDVRRRR